jgi:hypothetical protein
LSQLAAFSNESNGCGSRTIRALEQIRTLPASGQLALQAIHRFRHRSSKMAVPDAHILRGHRKWQNPVIKAGYGFVASP